jgi:hypothetical protein
MYPLFPIQIKRLLHLRRRWVLEKVPKPPWAWWSWPRPQPIMIPLPKSKSKKPMTTPIKISTLTPKNPLKSNLSFSFQSLNAQTKEK